MKTVSIATLVLDISALHADVDLWDEPENDTQNYTMAVEIHMGASMVSIATTIEDRGFVVISMRREGSHLIFGLSTPEQYRNNPVC